MRSLDEYARDIGRQIVEAEERGLRRGMGEETAELLLNQAARIRELENAILDLLLAEQEHGYYSDEFYAAKRAAEAAANGGEA